MRLLIKNFIVLGVFCFFFFLFTKITADHTAKISISEPDSSLTIIFLGDIMQHKPQIDAAWDDSLQTYSYDSCFKYIAPLIRDNDLAIANFEFTLGGRPYTGYPQFSAPDQIVQALLNAGIDIVGTANNHSCDRGRKGIERTIRILDSVGLPHLGTYSDSLSWAALHPMIINKKGFKIALLNYTYGTNGIPIPSPNVVNMMDEKQMIMDLKRAKDSLPDKTIVFIHWGDEYKSQPNQYQQHFAKLCFDNGADIIIGMHPHVIQKIERLNYPDSSGRDVLIAYSLGNYVSNQRARYKDGGMMVKLKLVKQNNVTKIANCGYFLNWVYTPVEKGMRRFYILPVSQYENTTDFMDAASLQTMGIYATDSRELMKKESKKINEFIFDPETGLWK